MNFKYLLCITFFLMLRGISFSQNNFITNTELADKLIDESFTEINNKLLLLGRDKFYLVIADDNNEAGIYLLENFKRKFNGYKLIIGEDSDSISYKLVFKNPVIKTTYKKIFTDNMLGTKKIAREVLVSYNLELIEKKKSSLIYNQVFDKKVKDEFDLDKLSNVEDNRYLFSRSAIPEDNTINQILYPAIILTISAAAIILFFTIRSK